MRAVLVGSWLIYAFIFVVSSGFPADQASATGAPREHTRYTHADYFAHYEGTATCLQCHEEAAQSFFASQHYQWRGETPALVNTKGTKLGKINTVNDFCTSPAASWIGNVKNSRGEVVAQGCSKCHAGLGLLPAEEPSREQLENIDCLICHAAGYRRDLYQDVAGGWAWKPILWKNQEGLDSVAKRIMLPDRSMCLRCHAGAGGGPNYKRGDIEYALADCDREFDVHMGKNGADLQCVTCHASGNHRVRGRGADLAATDAPGDHLSCADAACHGEAPHAAPALNKHVTRVSCTTCHIPSFAKSDPTDMARDWSRPVRNEQADKYSATIVLEMDVRPVYAWFNGKTRAQLMGEPVSRQADGTVEIMMPQGGRRDRDARIHPFKLHRGVLPVLADKQWLVPIAVDEFFADGDIDNAVRKGAVAAYATALPTANSRKAPGAELAYEWVPIVRYMGLNHEVAPRERALQCLDCHSPSGRLDWQALGYKRDPLDEAFRGR